MDEHVDLLNELPTLKSLFEYECESPCPELRRSMSPHLLELETLKSDADWLQDLSKRG